MWELTATFGGTALATGQTKSEKEPSDVGVAVEVEVDEPGSSVHEVVSELGGESAVAEVGQGSGSEEVDKDDRA